MKKLRLLSLLLLPFVLHAQDFNRYQTLESSGNLPADLMLTASKKYNAELKNISQTDYTKQEKEARKTFALESNFVLDDLLKSGLVLFNDPVSQYLNEVSGLVSKSLSTNKNIRVYALRSTAVNAFATSQGAIFVTLGLLAQLENEAQLAYIIAHEITHVLENHPVDLYLEAKDIEKGSSQRSVFGSTTFDDKVLAKNRYSKELESAADDNGLELMRKSDYSTATLNTVFDVLKYSYLPFDEIPFERTFIETDGLRYPNAYWLEKVNPIRGEDENADDSKSDHPNIGQRRTALAQALQAGSGSGTRNFILPEERFHTIQKIARFELPQLHLHRGQFAESIYTAYLLQRETPSLYLQKCMVKAFYLHSKYLNDGEYSFDVKLDSIEGEIQGVFNFLSKIKPSEATVLALQKAWKLHLEDKSDREVAQIVEDLFVELATKFSSFDELSKPQTNTSIQTATVADTSTTNNSKVRSKFDRIREKQKLEAPSTPEATFSSNAFDAFINDPSFKTAFEQGQSTYKKRQEDEAQFTKNFNQAAWKKRELKEMRHGANLGISKVVMVNPFFIKLNEKSDNPALYLDTEIGQNRFNTLMRESAKLAGLKTVFLDVEDLKENQTDQFNDIRVLNEWFAEQVQFSDLSLTPGLQQSRIDTLASKYETEYFLWTGAISLMPRKRNALGPIVGGLFFWPQFPWAIANAANPKYDVLYYAILFDVKTMRRWVIKFEYFKYNDFETVVKAHSYDAFLQMRKK